MRQKFLSLGLAAALLSAGCATDPYGSTNAGNRAMIGAGVGAALGALGGAAIGVDPVSGAAFGAFAGGAAGALMPAGVVNGRQYYRDTRGYCYYIDRNGQTRYDPSVRC